MKKKGSPILTILIVLLCTTFLCPQSFFETSSKKDIPIMSGAIGGLGLNLYLGKNLRPLTMEEVRLLHQRQIPSFDRWACQNFSPKADKLSDMLLNICVFSPVLQLASPTLDSGQKWTYALMYLETGILTYSITEFAKIMSKRIRPFLYNPGVPLRDKIGSSNARKSFFSGHTSMSFAGAVFLAQTYASYHPDSRWKPVVWGIGLSTATLVGVLRIISGKHFPTDVFVGALVGSFIGIIIPKLHETDSASKNNSNRSFQVSFRFSF